MASFRPVILFVGMWVDEDPSGGLPPRAARLPEVVAAVGYELVTIHRTALDPAPWLAHPPAGIIISGSRYNLGEDCEVADFPAVMALLDGLQQVPTLGICFGCQLFAYADGGSLDRFGVARRTADWPVSHPVDRRFTDHPLFAGLPNPCPLGENHCQRVLDPGPNYRVIARSDDGIEAIAHVALPRIGVQFHPEYFPEQAVPHGRRVLDNWLASIAAR